MEKLPAWYKPKWSNKVLKFQKTNGKESFPSLEDFVNHVSYEADRTNIPQLASAAEPSTKDLLNNSKNNSGPPRRKTPATTLTSSAKEYSSQTPPKSDKRTITLPRTLAKPSVFCFYHEKGSHALKDCEHISKAKLQRSQRLSYDSSDLSQVC